ncbi:hypothetical protein HPB49_004010 [Dermacentor silvarum]|uniref:Uncharacterized protein n=1 Tax=Dermacentor silvarum TaxID=543639 RepID=A0ACB8DMW3_DERSI|nr:hypothetical protein HPB49_004010 [Dermacentor silvarum]
MAYCCVPLCKSDEKKIAGISFHEVPSDLQLRQKWLVAVRRDGWTPNDSSCYTKVCSQHFKQEDFIEGKRRRLKKGTVPSVLDDYPRHLQPKAVRERGLSSLIKRARVTVVRQTDASQAVASPSILLPSLISDKPMAEEEEDASMEVSFCAHEPVGQCDARYCGDKAKRDRSVQVNSRAPPSLLIAKRTKWKRKERDLKIQIQQLRQRVDRYNLELNRLKEDILTDDICYIRKAASEKQPAAFFLLDQIRNFRKKRPAWSEETTRHCVVLRHLSTRAYEHMRGKELLKLPSRNTLSAYVGIQNGETGFTKLVEARLKTECQNL